MTDHSPEPHHDGGGWESIGEVAARIVEEIDPRRRAASGGGAPAGEEKAATAP